MSLQPNVVGHKNMSITIALGVMVMLLLFSSCSGRKKDMGAAITERDSLPVMDTKGVTTLISDSGITRYRVNTAEWLIYDRKNPPYWAFEKGIYLEKFDSVFHTEASIKADTAYYYNKKELWKLMGNVHVQNLKGEKFDTELLYWDQNKKRMYTELASEHPIDLCRYQVANGYMGRVGLINSGGESHGSSDLRDAVITAVVNKRAGGMGLISGRKAFQKPMNEGVELLNTIQDVYLDSSITIA